MKSLLIRAILGHKHNGIKRRLNEICAHNSLPWDQRQAIQFKQLHALLQKTYSTSKFYKHKWDTFGVVPHDIANLSDLRRLPTVDKSEFKRNVSDIQKKGEAHCIHGTTGGTTGIPLQYLLSRESNTRGRALLYYGWGLGGYRLGDRLLCFAGGSLSGQPTLQSSLRNWVLNFDTFSSGCIDNEKLSRVYDHARMTKPRYMRGYASSLYAFARFMRDSNLPETSIRAVFSTSEPMLPGMRDVIQRSMKCDVFDQYGVNDGGVSAYECPAHNGMHIDTYRAVLEVINNDNKPVEDGEIGRVIATDLFNTACPFIRYETGDMAIIDSSPCNCGNTAPRITKMAGRSADTLTIGGKCLSGSFITVAAGKHDLDMYTVIQRRDGRIEFHALVRGDAQNEDLQETQKSLSNFFNGNLPASEVSFYFHRELSTYPAPKNKRQFIVREE